MPRVYLDIIKNIPLEYRDKLGVWGLNGMAPNLGPAIHTLIKNVINNTPTVGRDKDSWSKIKIPKDKLDEPFLYEMDTSDPNTSASKFKSKKIRHYHFGTDDCADDEPHDFSGCDAGIYHSPIKPTAESHFSKDNLRGKTSDVLVYYLIKYENNETVIIFLCFAKHGSFDSVADFAIQHSSSTVGSVA